MPQKYSHKCSLIEGLRLRLGRAATNVDNYIPLDIFEIPLETGMYTQTSTKFKEVPKEYFLPRVFAQASKKEGSRVPGIYTGKRCVAIPSKIVSLDLKSLGLSKKPIKQDFVLEIKGAGLILGRSEIISHNALRKFCENHGVNLGEEARNELLFSSREYRQFMTPEGAQLEYSAELSLNASNFLLSKNSPVNLKIAPVLRFIRYPNDIQIFADEIGNLSESKQRELKGWLVQELRLMPSFVRAAYFEHNPESRQQLVRMINKDEKHLNRLTNVFLNDAVPFFEMLAKTTKKSGSSFSWVNIGNTEPMFNEPEKLYKKDYAWYFAKDLVLAPTGIYFVDNEVTELDHSAYSENEMKKQHQIYLTSLIKDFSRVISLYEAGLKGIYGSSDLGNVFDRTKNSLIEIINESKFVEARKSGEDIEIKMKYAHIPRVTYKIEGRYLPKIGGFR